MPKTAMSSMKSSIPCGNFLAGWQEVTTKSTKAAKGDENVYEDSLVLFVSFVVKLLLIMAAHRAVR
jgi:hypothetical protein